MIEAEEVSQKKGMSCEVFPSRSEPLSLGVAKALHQAVTFVSLLL